MARRASTATIAIPIAEATAPMSNPIPRGTAHDPLHWIATSEYPIRAPASPPKQMPMKAMSRAAGGGSAESGRCCITGAPGGSAAWCSPPQRYRHVSVAVVPDAGSGALGSLTRPIPHGRLGE